MTSKNYTTLQILIVFITFYTISYCLACKIDDLYEQVHSNQITIEKLTELEP